MERYDMLFFIQFVYFILIIFNVLLFRYIDGAL